jgi:hypothetical protein
LKNLRKAFYLLDDDKDGIIKYDISRLSGSINNNINSPENEGDTVILNIDQFIEIMIRKIISHREKYPGKISYESGN